MAAAGCVTTGSNLLDAPDSLDNRTQRFYDEVRRERADDHSWRDAEALADAADDFRRAVERSRVARRRSSSARFRFKR